ncbi:MAG TPA: polysaccharide biosynthesis/export family protein [Thermoanaerobaculia bacterium]|jgi:polysaccharide export outer membrane protein
MKRHLILAISIVLAAVSAAAQTDLPLLSSDNVIGPRDVLEVRVLEDPTISGRAVVNDDGQIILNVVGKVRAAGMTAAQVEASLKQLLESKYITGKATVSVQVSEYGSKPISIVGSVHNPGRIGASGGMTLIQAITQAGGLTPGYGKELYILRTGSNGLSEQLSIDIEELMVSGNPDLNIPLAPNDLINVPVDTPVVIYVMGEVMKPGKAEFRRSQTPTLLQAIADAGGPTDRAAKNAVIKRTLAGGKQERMVINYRDIIKGKKADFVLQDNDTVVVEESIF